MTWTKLLEHRWFPPHARVREDLFCLGCGYNLRGLAARGNCSECGLPVGESLYTLREPDAVGGALLGIGRSYLATAAGIALALVALLPAFGVLRFFAVIILVLAAIVRAVAAAELRWRCALQRLPLLGAGVRWVWAFALLEALVAAAVIAWMQFPGAFDPLRNTWPWLPPLWGALATVSALAVGAWGRHLGAILGYDLPTRELHRQRAVLIVMPPLGALLLGAGTLASAAGGATVGDAIAAIGIALLGLGWAVGLFLTIMGLMHLSSAALQERGRRDDLVETEPLYEAVSRAEVAEQKAREALPDIPLEDGA